MSFDPFLAAPLNIQIHAALAALALLLGPIALWRRKRDRVHKYLGYVWVVSMGGTAIGSFWIASNFTPIGLGPIHLLSVYALWGLWEAMRGIYIGNIRQHKQAMEALYMRGLALAGAFSLLPGRVSAQALIPETPWIGYLVIAAVAAWAFRPLIGKSFGSVAKRA